MGIADDPDLLLQQVRRMAKDAQARKIVAAEPVFAKLNVYVARAVAAEMVLAMRALI